MHLILEPIKGRTFAREEQGQGHDDTIVISERLWNKRFNADPMLIGKTLLLNGRQYTVIGIMPAGFTFPGAPNDFWVPSRLDAKFRANRDQYFIAAIGRLAPGTTIEQARAEMRLVSQPQRNSIGSAG